MRGTAASNDGRHLHRPMAPSWVDICASEAAHLVTGALPFPSARPNPRRRARGVSLCGAIAHRFPSVAHPGWGVDGPCPGPQSLRKNRSMCGTSGWIEFQNERIDRFHTGRGAFGGDYCDGYVASSAVGRRPRVRHACGGRHAAGADRVIEFIQSIGVLNTSLSIDSRCD